MSRERRVKDMTAAVQRFRRRVIAMLDARADALHTLRNPTEESRAHMHAISRVRDIIKEMR